MYETISETSVKSQVLQRLPLDYSAIGIVTITTIIENIPSSFQLDILSHSSAMCEVKLHSFISSRQMVKHFGVKFVSYIYMHTYIQYTFNVGPTEITYMKFYVVKS